MSSMSLQNLPTEVIHDFILPNLLDNDIRSLGESGSKRLKEITEDYVRNNKRKFLLSLLDNKIIHCYSFIVICIFNDMSKL